ncbi:MAG TPA: phage protein GemA/Gp16 family protein [Longimicrobiaceae bacterium]|jgi:hypothetical protein
MPNRAQLKKIFAASRELGLDEEQLRDQVEELSGARSISKLSEAHTRQLLDLLVRAGARTPAPRKKPSGRRTAPNETLLITPDQRTEIERLREELGGDWTRDAYFQGACRKRIKLDGPRTAGEAVQVIEMLKQRRAYDRGKRRT